MKQTTTNRPIACLLLTRKLLTGIIADEICGFLENEGVFPDKQKGCRRKSKGTGDQLCIYKILLQEVKQRKKNFATGLIYYRKAYNMVPHSRVIDSLNMIGMAKNVVNFLVKKKKMKPRRVKLTYGPETLTEVPIKGGIFQRYALSPVLFAIALIPLTTIL